MIALGKNEYVLHQLELPVSKKIVEFRPWKMVEQTVLLNAYSGGSKLEIRRAIRQVLSNIVQGTQIGKIPFADAEYLFVNARARSVGEKIEVVLDKVGTKEVRKVNISIPDIKVSIPDGKNYDIPVIDSSGKPTGVTFRMREPGFDDIIDVLTIKENNPDSNEEIELLSRCVDKVYTKEELSEGSEQLKEIIEYFSSMTPIQYEPFEGFLINVPTLRYEIELSTLFTGETGKHVFEGIDDFFE